MKGRNFKEMLKHEAFFAKKYTKSNLSLVVKGRKKKRKKIPPKETIDNYMSEMIDFLKHIGQADKAFVIKEVYENSCVLADRLKKVINDCPDKSHQMSPLDASALLLNSDLTKQQYLDIKAASDKHGHYLLPSYDFIVEEKKKMEPENISVTEDKAYVPLKNLMIKTVDRFLESEDFVTTVNRLEKKNDGNTLNIEASYKAGYDVASGQKRYQVSQILMSLFL